MARPLGALTVRELTHMIRDLLQGASELQGVWVRGEISNYRRHTSGHLYFTLKDDTASVRCVMFRSKASRMKFEPEDGMAVLAYGSVSVYERDGQYQLYVDDIQPDGIGSLYKAYLQLKARLEAEGLFEAALKRRLPALPRRVGVVTSIKGAAVRDIINIARRRHPGVRLVLCEVLVQGEAAPDDIVRGLEMVVQVPEVDVVILGRGGGSIEELWAFNSEKVARAIRACPVPVVSAIGHETDFTIADFASDVRAPTPSAAAELVVPDAEETCARTIVLRDRAKQAVSRMLAEKRYALGSLVSRPVLRRPEDLVNERRQALDDLLKDALSWTRRLVENKDAQARSLVGRLEALSPLKILARGYAICSDASGELLKSVRAVDLREVVGVRLSDGRLECEIKGKTAWNPGGKEEDGGAR
ncbi:MAG: exodeoxyribonuclease VII large subunit [Bacillota bacterium]|nr:exodeoxyribonuclease VII large subunit [Bacillota bacterium]